jgi:GNAT superfamily N-acetyltransferase
LASVLSTNFRENRVASTGRLGHAGAMDLDTPSLTIAPLRADDPAAVEAEYEILRAARTVDVPDFPPPCRYQHEARLRHPWPGRDTRYAMAYLGGTAVGRYALELSTIDNLENAELDITVHPAHRRQGVGRRLFEHATGQARLEGRKRVMCMSVETLPGGPVRSEAGKAFAHAIGMTNALTDVRRRLDVPSIDPADHERLLAEAWAKAAGYSVVQWQATTPEEHVDDVAKLDSSFLEEAPLGDLAWEPEKVDAERVRRADAIRSAHGARPYNTGLVHDASGRLVAWSALVVFSTVPWHAWQNITLVDPTHRGHRLGILSKIINLQYLLANEPEVRVIDTWNAGVNKHMIAINEAMGFRAVDAWANWQRDV